MNSTGAQASPFHSKNGLGCNYYRIPAMITTKQGVTIAAIDARFGGTYDSPNNLDTAVSRSVDAGKTWLTPKLPFHFTDYEDSGALLPPGAGAMKTRQSASTIDPCLLEDRATGRVFLLVDQFPAGCGSLQAQTGCGYVQVGNEACLRLRKKGSLAFRYYARPDGVVCGLDGTPTCYSLNAEYELLKDGQPLFLRQRRVRVGKTAVHTQKTGQKAPMHVFYADSLFQVEKTSYLFLRYSDDQGETWSEPISLNPMVKPPEMRVLVTGPGCGIQLQSGAHAGRLLFPVYHVTHAFREQSCMTVYSDDHGETWRLGGGPRYSREIGMMSESQLVELPDGSVQVFARTKAGKIATAHSADGGVTWGGGALVPELPLAKGSGCQLSAIRYEGLIDGRPAVLVSAPAGPGREHGMLHIGLLSEREGAGMPYAFDWRYHFPITGQGCDFAYSCLAQLPDGKIGILYEGMERAQSVDAIRFQAFSLETLAYENKYIPANN